MDYIKKLRTCIRGLQESEASQMSQKESLQNQLNEERRDRNLAGCIFFCYAMSYSIPLI